MVVVMMAVVPLHHNSSDRRLPKEHATALLESRPNFAKTSRNAITLEVRIKPGCQLDVVAMMAVVPLHIRRNEPSPPGEALA